MNNNNSNIQLRSKAWSEFLNRDKEIKSLFYKVMEISNKAKTAQMCGNINDWQELSNKTKVISNQITVKQMQMQIIFLALADANEKPLKFAYN